MNWFWLLGGFLSGVVATMVAGVAYCYWASREVQPMPDEDWFV